MGQIIIDIPSNKNRRYAVADMHDAESLVKDLEANAVRIKGNPPRLTPEELEDIRDGQRADRAVARSKGKTVPWDKVKRDLGL